MKILRLNRGEGKTTELIKQSNKEWKYILCSNRAKLDLIIRTAKEMQLDIPFPIIVSELPIKGRYIKEILIDDFEGVLQALIGAKVDIATTSCEIINL